ncbi:trichohyalin-like [Mercenaria mercenaria]|uniref:trichohyalin-like n=1 Tax=Mercenaria mercenaria TaxID=6596 RepID=UPI00234E64F5|nr:trichohyalin-like [Mercenaria mercenaria]
MRQDYTNKGIQSQDKGKLQKDSYRKHKVLRKEGDERRTPMSDGSKYLDQIRSHRAKTDDKSEKSRQYKEKEAIEERIKQKEREMQLLKQEESMRERKATERLEKKEYELDKLIAEQEEYQRKLVVRQKEQELEFLMEKKRLSDEVESFKQQLNEDMLRKETEMRQRHDMIEEIVRKDMEMRIRKEMEENIRKELEVKMQNDTKEERRKQEESERRKMLDSEREMEARNRKEIEERRRKREQREKALKLRREKQKEKEDELMKRIQTLKVREEEVNAEQETESTDDEEGKEIEERIRRLREEKESLEKRHKERRGKAKDDKKEQKDEEDTRRLLSKPKIPQFDGNQFEEWKLEITSLIETKLYKEYILAQAVRNSITGKARKVLLTLKPSASTKEILKKMEDIYGNIRSGDSIIHDFYSAKQTRGEPCSEWGVRIETLFYQALERGEIEESRKDSKLKERFWRGLLSEKIKIATRSAYESSGSFDTLRKKARIEELEVESETLPSEHGVKESDVKSVIRNIPEQVNTHQPIRRAEETNATMDELLKKMMELEKEIRDIKSNQSGNTESKRGTGGYRPRPYGRPYRWRRYGDDRSVDDNSKKSEEKKKETPPKDHSSEKSKDNLN